MKLTNVILVGFMGTGKSTVGQALAVRLGWEFADTDDWIERREGRGIPEIFTAKGEAYFRHLEASVLEDCLRQGHRVIATGGGAVLAAANRALMKASGKVVHLWADQATIVSRVGQDPNRPLLQGGVEERVARLMKEREHAYDFADLRVDTTGHTVDEIVDLIVEGMAQ